jgi:transposase
MLGRQDGDCCCEGFAISRTPHAAGGTRDPSGQAAVGELWDRRRSHVRPNSRQTSIARTRQVTVAKNICGVDVSSFSLDARIGHLGPSGVFANTAEGSLDLAAFCRQHDVELVAMEATGGYEKQAFAVLCAQGLPVALLNPRAVRRFAEGMGLLEKTDRIDAGVIARFADAKRSVPTTPASAAQQRLRALVTRLGQLTELQTAQRNQRLLVSEITVLASFREVLALLTAQIRTLEAAIIEVIAADPLWQKLDQAFRSIKGVADRTVARLMAEMPEIGLLSNKAVSKLAGLAPLARDSGKHQGKRPIRGGRSNVRAILFVVAGVVRRYDADFAAFHQRLAAAGKPKKVIRIALAHKLLVRLNAKARQTRQEFPTVTP